MVEHLKLPRGTSRSTQYFRHFLLVHGPYVHIHTHTTHLSFTIIIYPTLVEDDGMDICSTTQTD